MGGICEGYIRETSRFQCIFVLVSSRVVLSLTPGEGGWIYKKGRDARREF